MLPCGFLLHGYFLGSNSRTFRETGNTLHYVSIACGTDSFSVTVDDLRPFADIDQFQEVYLACRPYVSKNGRLVLTDGALVGGTYG